MAKKKKTIQLLPFDYLVKIGRIKKHPWRDWIGDRGVNVPTSMKNEWDSIRVKNSEKNSRGGAKVIVTSTPWWIQTNWLKP